MGKIRRICDDKVGAAGVILVLVLVAHTGFGGFPGDAVPLQNAAQALLLRGHHADNNIAEFIAAAFKQGGGVQHAGVAASTLGGIHAGFTFRQNEGKGDVHQPLQLLQPGKNNGGKGRAVDGAVRLLHAGKGGGDGGAIISTYGTEFVNEVTDHVLEYLAVEQGIEIYRPTIFEDDNGEPMMTEFPYSKEKN